jgi:hypothetical protein
MHTDSEILQFIYDRLAYKYGEDTNYDYMQNLDRIVNVLRSYERIPNQSKH